MAAEILVEKRVEVFKLKVQQKFQICQKELKNILEGGMVENKLCFSLIWPRY